MNVRKLLMMAVVAVPLGLPTTAAAQESFRDAGSKMRGEFGVSPRRMARRARPVYRAPAPVIVAEPAPAVAQAPTDRRTYSYEPAPTTAQRGTRTYRSYSYEPTYRYSPTFRSGARSRGPSYLLPKTDPNRYR
jgi:hypothetical protein